MINKIIHIGTPRTGTTTLQKHLFNKAKSNAIASKEPFQGGAKGLGIITNPSQLDTIQHHPEELRYKSRNSEHLSKLTKISILACDSRKTKLAEGLLKEYSNKLKQESIKSTVLFSSERFCDSSASLNGDSITKGDKILIHTLLEISKTAQEPIDVLVCFRSPIPYLRSKYIRTCLHRQSINARKLTPSEYIQKQSTLEINHQGTSALMPAMHSEFIKQLQQYAFVKAFGFQELRASADVFSLMGLQGEDKYAFRNFPRENKLSLRKEQEKAIEIEITQALKQYGFYDRIMKAQMFE